MEVRLNHDIGIGIGCAAAAEGIGILPGTVHRTSHLHAGGTIATTDTTFIKSPVRTYDAVTACLHALALNADRSGVRTAGCAISHLGVAKRL